MPRTRLSPRAPLVATALVAGVVALLLAPGYGNAVPSASAAAPAPSATPTISGTAATGRTLTGGTGSWSGTTPITFAFRWVRCDSAGSSCVDISGATSQTYVLQPADVGKRLRLRVTATNADGSATALSDATAVVVTTTPPKNTAEPVISGDVVQGQTLTTTNGSWSGSPTSYTYRWVRCGTNGGEPDGSNCTPISGATSSTLVLTAGDVGRRLRARVTASNPGGASVATSNPTATVKAAPNAGKPANVVEPAIGGIAAVGATLTATTGTWTGATPITFSYRWVRCGTDGGKPDGSNCAAIGGATSSTFKPGASELGRRLRVQVTAKNAAGSTLVASNATAAVAPAAPPGTITLPNGERSIPATSVPADQRLVVSQVVFSPNPVRSRTEPLVVRIRVKDTRGYVVREARVFIRSTPRVTTGVRDVVTGTDGWIQVTLAPLSSFPQLRKGTNLQFFVKAYRAGDPTLGGVAGTRLVQVALG